MKKFIITVNGKAYDVEVSEVVPGGKVLTRPNRPVPATPATVAAPTPAPAPVQAAPQAAAPQTAPVAKPAAAVDVPAGATNVAAPMPGKILSVAVEIGSEVKAGQAVCVLEAMKMQNEIAAPVDGKVVDIRVAPNQNVATAEVLVVIA